MKNKLIFSGIVLGVGLLQVTVLDNFRVLNVKPDLLLIMTVIAGLSFEMTWVLIFSILAGLFKDLFGTNTFGLNAVFFAVWGYLVFRANKEVNLDYFLIKFALMALVALANSIVNAAALIYFGNAVPFGVMLRGVILNTAYTAAVFPLTYKIIKS
jgi:rod shape-determining protein MreD